jgi:RNA polymerase sigma-70 factor, ECF subfamily
MLAEDAAFYSDGGGKVTAVRKPIFGRARLARMLVMMTRTVRRRRGPFSRELVTVGGHPGVISRTPDGKVVEVVSFDVVAGRVQAIRVVRNPDTLRHLNCVDPARRLRRARTGRAAGKQ